MSSKNKQAKQSRQQEVETKKNVSPQNREEHLPKSIKILGYDEPVIKYLSEYPKYRNLLSMFTDINGDDLKYFSQFDLVEACSTENKLLMFLCCKLVLKPYIKWDDYDSDDDFSDSD